MSPKITLAAIRHYFRALNLKGEAEERVDEDEMDRQVDEAIKNKKPLDFAVLSDESEMFWSPRRWQRTQSTSPLGRSLAACCSLAPTT
jgi:hypothetical protein